MISANLCRSASNGAASSSARTVAGSRIEQVRSTARKRRSMAAVLAFPARWKQQGKRENSLDAHDPAGIGDHLMQSFRDRQAAGLFRVEPAGFRKLVVLRDLAGYPMCRERQDDKVPMSRLGMQHFTNPSRPGDLDGQSGFLEDFALERLGDSFATLDAAAGKGPAHSLRVDGPTCQEDLAVAENACADRNLRSCGDGVGHVFRLP